jgi:excisionase family DNA binding protein
LLPSNTTEHFRSESFGEAQVQIAVQPERLYRPREVMDLLGIGQTRLYELLKRGELKRCKVGASTRIPASSIAAWQAKLAREAAA